LIEEDPMGTLQEKKPLLLPSVLNPQGQLKTELQLESIYAQPTLGKVAGKEKPSTEIVNDKQKLAPRLGTLKGKTIYLVDESFGGGYELLSEMQEWFSVNMPEVRTVLRRKKGNMFMDDRDLWEEIKSRGDAMILGVGG
jgi:hypothetical protein